MKKTRIKYLAIVLIYVLITAYLTKTVIAEYKTVNKIKGDIISSKLTLEKSSKISFDKYREQFKELGKKTIIGEDISKVVSDIDSKIIDSNCKKVNLRVLKNNSAEKSEADKSDKKVSVTDNRIIITVSGTDNELNLLLRSILSEKKKYCLLSFTKRTEDEVSTAEINLIVSSIAPGNIELLENRNIMKRFQTVNSREVGRVVGETIDNADDDESYKSDNIVDDKIENKSDNIAEYSASDNKEEELSDRTTSDTAYSGKLENFEEEKANIYNYECTDNSSIEVHYPDYGNILAEIYEKVYLEAENYKYVALNTESKTVSLLEGSPVFEYLYEIDFIDLLLSNNEEIEFNSECEERVIEILPLLNEDD